MSDWERHAIMITYQGNKRTVTPIAFLSEAGFTDLGTPHVRHCGRFARVGAQPLRLDSGMTVQQSYYKCSHCDTSALFWRQPAQERTE